MDSDYPNDVSFDSNVELLESFFFFFPLSCPEIFHNSTERVEGRHHYSHWADEQTKDAGSISDLASITLLGDLGFVAKIFATFPNKVSGKEGGQGR